jgi:protein MpaA
MLVTKAKTLWDLAVRKTIIIFLTTTTLAALIGCQHIRRISQSDPNQQTQVQKPQKSGKTKVAAQTDQQKQQKTKESIVKASHHRDVKPRQTPAVKQYCHKIEQTFKRYRWDKSGCEHINWNHVRNSNQGDPLIWTVFGNENAHRKNIKNATMFLCGVHGDEITPIKFCFDLIHFLEEKFDRQYSDTLIVVAPIVNPDSFFKRRPTRTNAKGVDINRNFPTNDWHKKAISLWKRRYRSDKRRYPGKRPISEPEVVFQVNLLARYKPGKIISVHAPLTMLDYDGPGEGLAANLQKNQKGRVASQLLVQMSKKASGYRVKNYPFFPGSLGNYAGNERQIPTITLELPSSDYTKTDQFWKLFRSSMHDAIITDMRPCKFNGPQGSCVSDTHQETKGQGQI